MRAIIAAGGTAGHINPAIAIANEIMKNEPDSQIVFVGREDGMEKKLVETAGFKIFPIEIHGFSRSLKPKEIAFNARAVKCAIAGSASARKLFLEFKPDIVIGCGGYVSGPVVRKAAQMGIKTAVQEQNSFPGITNKILSKQVDLVMVACEDAISRLHCKSKCVVTGNPIRSEFFSADREKLRREWGAKGKTVVVSFGGSLGARTINLLSAKFMQLHIGMDDIYHIHATGRYATESFPKLLRELGVNPDSKNLKIVEYIENMPECFAAADMVIGRSGALTISEISAAGKASVLIPSPNVAENHQYFNAMTLVNAGAAVVFEENEMDTDKAAKEILELALDRQRLKLMGVNARAVAVKDSAGKIYGYIKELLSR
ncbi:MAG: undecaprenyldiphospho-muramoylpentapeptide beta-N-acetylglucosaminyltransferase [Oscillospiraceae bacterium]